LLIGALAVGTLFLSFGAPAQTVLRDLPPLLRAISDEAGVLSVTEGQVLAQAVSEMRHESRVQIIVLIAETTAPESVEEYTLRLATEWRSRDGYSDIEDRIFVVVSVGDRALYIGSDASLQPIADTVTKGPLTHEFVTQFRRAEYFTALTRIVTRLSVAARQRNGCMAPPECFH
jgi:uncharacterized protein